MINKKLFIFLSALYCMVGQPFEFSYLFLGGKQYMIKLLIILFLALFTIKVKNKPKILQKGLPLVGFWAFMSIIFNIESIMPTIYFIFDVIFFAEFLIITSVLKGIPNLIYKYEMGISVFIAISCIIGTLMFLYIPDIFIYLDDMDGYPVFYNRFLGLISIWGRRYCWFFAEPSYCGFYLGVHFMLFLNCKTLKRKYQVMAMFIILIAMFTVFSKGTILYLPAALIIYYVDKFNAKIHLSRRLLSSFIYFALFYVIIILPKMDVDNISPNTQVNVSQETSFDDRQERAIMADKVLNELGGQLIIGCGMEGVTRKFHIGISDAYRKMFVEQGLFFFVLFMIFLRKFTYDNFAVHTYICMSFLSVIIHLAPISLIIYYVTRQQLICNKIN